MNTDLSKLVTIAHRMSRGQNSESMLRTIDSWPWDDLDNIRIGYALIRGPDDTDMKEAVNYIRDIAGV